MVVGGTHARVAPTGEKIPNGDGGTAADFIVVLPPAVNGACRRDVEEVGIASDFIVELKDADGGFLF